MSERFELRVLTPSAEVFTGIVDGVTASGHSGDFGVLPGHYAYVTSVKPGILAFDSAGKKHRYAVGHGLAQVSADRVSIVVSRSEDASGIDVAAAKAALADAEKVLMDSTPGEPANADALVQQELSLGRLRAAEFHGE